MGNCIGKRSSESKASYRHDPSARITGRLSHGHVQSSSQHIVPLTLAPTCTGRSHALNTSEPAVTVNEDEKSETDGIEYSSSLLVTTTERQFTYSSSPAPLRCERVPASNTVIDFTANKVETFITLGTAATPETIMGALFSKKNKLDEDDQSVPIGARLEELESLGTSPSPSMTESSSSLYSHHTTPFSSQDQLILSSSSSSPPISLAHPLREQLDDDQSLPSDSFSSILPVLSSRHNHDPFFNDFHREIVSHDCKLLRSAIDDIIQQQGIRIHRRVKSVLIEHKQLACQHLTTLKKSNRPALIFDEAHHLVHITKHARWTDVQSLAVASNVASRIPDLFSSCDHCSSLLSGSKVTQRLRSFLLVNTTHDLIRQCLGRATPNHRFGFISQTHPHEIRQTIVDNSKFMYSSDLDVDHTSYYFVLRVNAWPEELRCAYEKRPRLWPMNWTTLFERTCFIRVQGHHEDVSTQSQCATCDKRLSLASSPCWSYTYAAIEAQLVARLSDDHLSFASIAWNYLHGKLEGQLPFRVFKHTLFYFFEQFSLDSFLTRDLLSHTHLFIDFLFVRLQSKSLPHYFNPTDNLYDDRLSTLLSRFLSLDITYTALKHSSTCPLANSSLYLYHLFYLIKFQSNFFQGLLSSKIHSIQTILDTHDFVLGQLASGVKTNGQPFDSTLATKSHRPLTLDRLYRYQEDNVQVLLDYLPLLREREPSLMAHSLWSMFIQYFNCMFDDLFVSDNEDNGKQ